MIHQHSMIIIGPSGTVELTVREYAQMERVACKTVYRWIEKGAVAYRRTPTGRIRIQQPGYIVDNRGHLTD